MGLSRELRKIFKLKKAERPADVYIVSYPKSGRTWLRVMMCRYLAVKYRLEGDVALDSLKATEKAGLPLTRFTHDQAYMSWRLSYSKLKFDKERFGGKKVLFLGRDIRDTLVSAYHQATKRNVVFKGPISKFVRDERFGVRKIVRFYQMWIENKAEPSELLYVSYEEMKKDPAQILRESLVFIGEDNIDETVLQNAVEYGSFDNMRKIEMSMAAGSSILKPGDVNLQESFKTRQGLVGGYTKELSPEDIEYVNSIIGDMDPAALAVR